MPKQNVDYSKTVIYKIVCNDLSITDCYIGSTTNFTKRKSHHKNSCHSPLDHEYETKKYLTIRNNGGWANWAMIEIEKYPCADSNEARARERYWYELISSNLNTIKPIRSSEERKEYFKQYYEDNKDSIKKYNNEHKEEQAEKRKEYYSVQSQDADFKIKARERVKQWAIDNSEKVKAYRENNRDELNRRKREKRALLKALSTQQAT